jgi:hypothetical protein
MPSRQPQYSKEEFARLGDEIYYRDVYPQLQADSVGKIVAVDIATDFDCTSWFSVCSSIWC